MLVWCLLALIPSVVFGQVRPGFFPEDVEPTTLAVGCLCKPGVMNQSRGRGLELSFLYMFDSPLNAEGDTVLTSPVSELSLQNFTFKLRLPVVNKPGFKALLGVVYRPEHYDFSVIGVEYAPIFRHMDGRNLNSSGIETILTKSWNEHFYTSSRLRVLYNGDYSGLIKAKSRYAIYSASLLLGFKKKPTREWGVGLTFNHSFRSTIALPFFLYNQTFDEHWGVEMLLPTLMNLRYNLSEKTALFLGARYNSRSYALSVPATGGTYNLNHSEIRLTASVEHRIQNWVWVELDAGTQKHFSTDFEARGEGIESFKVEPGMSPYFKVGLFISPPDSYLK